MEEYFNEFINELKVPLEELMEEKGEDVSKMIYLRISYRYPIWWDESYRIRRIDILLNEYFMEA